MFPDIEIIKKNLTLCPICYATMTYRLQEMQIRDSEADSWRPNNIYIFECSNSFNKNISDTNLVFSETHFDFTIYDDMMEATYISWINKTDSNEQKLEIIYEDSEKLIIDRIIYLSQNYSGHELADKIKLKIKNYLLMS